MMEERTLHYKHEDVMSYMKRVTKKRKVIPLEEQIKIAELTQEKKNSQEQYIKIILSHSLHCDI